MTTKAKRSTVQLFEGSTVYWAGAPIRFQVITFLLFNKKKSRKHSGHTGINDLKPTLMLDIHLQANQMNATIKHKQ